MWLFKCCAFGACVCLFQRTDEEAVVDRGGTRSMLNTNFEKEELEGKYQNTTSLTDGMSQHIYSQSTAEYVSNIAELLRAC